MPECDFCNSGEIEKGLLDQTPNFYHRANIVGAMTPGHSMIIPKKHLRCYGEMPKQFDREYLDFKATVGKRISEAFSFPIIIEQGIHGQSIPHAHAHFLPSVSDWYDFQKGVKFLDLIPEDIRVTKGSGVEDIRRVFEEEGEYVSLEEDGQLYICHTQGYNGQFRPIREFPCKLSGVSHLLFWQKMSEQEKEKNRRWIEETIKRLKIT